MMANFIIFFLLFKMKLHSEVLYCLRWKCPGETESGERYQRLPSKALHSSRSKTLSLRKCTQPSVLKDHCVVSSA